MTATWTPTASPSGLQGPRRLRKEVEDGINLGPPCVKHGVTENEACLGMTSDFRIVKTRENSRSEMEARPRRV
jgi:hypothetical protein